MSTLEAWIVGRVISGGSDDVWIIGRVVQQHHYDAFCMSFATREEML